MNRGAHAINAADNRMDRDAEKARQAEADALTVQTADSAMIGLLGGLSHARATKMALAVADAALNAYAAHTDGPMAAAWCGKKAGQLCPLSIKPDKFKAADAKLGWRSAANDGEGA